MGRMKIVVIVYLFFSRLSFFLSPVFLLYLALYLSLSLSLSLYLSLCVCVCVCVCVYISPSFLVDRFLLPVSFPLFNIFMVCFRYLIPRSPLSSTASSFFLILFL